MTFSAFCLWDVAHRYMDTFSIGPMVTARELVWLTSPFGHWDSNSRTSVFTAVCDRIHLDPHFPWYGYNAAAFSLQSKDHKLTETIHSVVFMLHEYILTPFYTVVTVDMSVEMSCKARVVADNSSCRLTFGFLPLGACSVEVRLLTTSEWPSFTFFYVEQVWGWL